MPGATNRPLCFEHLGGTCAPASGRGEGPGGVCALERQYRDRSASRRLRHHGGLHDGGRAQLVRGRRLGLRDASRPSVGCPRPQARRAGVRSQRRRSAARAAWILEVTGAAPEAVLVAIEVPHGPVVESLMERGFRVHAINPKQLDRFRDRFSPAGAKDDSRDAEVLGDALRTDPRCFRALQPLDPVVVELREGSRMAEDLKQERNRLGNRVRELLWRFYPQMLGLTDDVAAPGFLDLWRLIRPRRRRRGCAKRRLIACSSAIGSGGSRQPTYSSGCARPRSPCARHGERGDGPSRGRRQAARSGQTDRCWRLMSGLDRLTHCLVAAQEGAEGQRPEPCDADDPQSLPGVGRIVLATLLAEAFEALQRRDYRALRCLAGVAPSPSDPARAASCSCAKPPTSLAQRRLPLGRAWPRSTTREAKRNTRPFAPAATVMAARSGRSPIA